MNKDRVKAYEIIEEKYLDDIKSKATVLSHIKTKAKVICIENDDDNKVFTIGFKTPPKDDTGVAHIIEHTVLCGSKKYPAKDPFIELVKGSLNTFLNAMTYPDKTIYPVASCNDQDFKNLMDVYMDAVLNPNIYNTDKIFKQEGWHYELEDEADELTINGVVYNEMKGAFSAPDEVLSRTIMHDLFPDNTYSYESGGDPDYIPNLTYEDYLAFHKKYYHPSNSYIYIYGDADMAERLDYLDKEYLSKYDYLEVDSKINKQEAFSEIKKTRITYPITESESLEENTTLSYSFVVGQAGDELLSTAIQILDYALMGSNGAPLKQALLDKGIGKDISGTYEGGFLQPFYSITAEMADEIQAEDFYNTIKETLKNIIETGVNKDSIKAAINNMDFSYREMDYGRYPKGLMFGLRLFDNWLYDENPFLAFEGSKIFAKLREYINTDYYENLIKEYFLENKHAVMVINAPVKGLAKERDDKLKEKLSEIKSGFSKEELEKVVRETAELIEYQTTPSPKEDVEKIPMLEKKDIKREVKEYLNEEYEIDGVKVYSHDYETNKISYVELIFDITDMPYEMIPYMGILRTVLSSVNTEKYTYQDLSNEIMMNMGELSFSSSSYNTDPDGKTYINTFKATFKCFDESLNKSFDIASEVILNSVLEDKTRLKELIGEIKSRVMYRFMNTGNSLAGLRATSYFSKRNYEEDLRYGYGYYKVVEDIEKNFDDRYETLVEKLKECSEYIFRKDNLFVNYTHKKGDKVFEDNLKNFISKLPTGLSSRAHEYEKPVYVPEKKNEGFITSSQIQFVCLAGEYSDEFDPSFTVLRTILDYEYLWNNIRITGGAYGCGSTFGKKGICAFHTYRDPNLKRSIEVFKGIPEWVRNFDCSKRDMNKYIIGTFSSIDSPINVSVKGQTAMIQSLAGITKEKRQKDREKILDTDINVIRGLADRIEEAVSKENICVVGSQSKIEEDKDVFLTTLNLFE